MMQDPMGQTQDKEQTTGDDQMSIDQSDEWMESRFSI